jgi:hypothetical protein
MVGILGHEHCELRLPLDGMGIVAELIERDGAQCVWCGRDLWPADLTAEHLLPRSRRGHTTPENLAVACRRCNRARGTQAVSAYVKAQREAGAQPRVDTLLGALDRLARSARRAHAEYGERQRALLLRHLGGPAGAHRDQRRELRSRTRV